MENTPINPDGDELTRHHKFVDAVFWQSIAAKTRSLISRNFMWCRICVPKLLPGVVFQFETGKQMLTSIFLSLSANIFTIYPGFIEPSSRVQVATDKGLVVELVIACKPGEGVMSFSKIERKFCVPNATCYRKFSQAYHNLCK